MYNTILIFRDDWSKDPKKVGDDFKKQNYGKLLKKILDGIQKLTGTKDVSVDWFMETIMMNTAPLVKGQTIIKNAFFENTEMKYWDGSFSEYERTLKMNESKIIEMIKDGKLWTDQFGIHWKGIKQILH